MTATTSGMSGIRELTVDELEFVSGGNAVEKIVTVIKDVAAIGLILTGVIVNEVCPPCATPLIVAGGAM